MQITQKKKKFSAYPVGFIGILGAGSALKKKLAFSKKKQLLVEAHP